MVSESPITPADTALRGARRVRPLPGYRPPAHRAGRDNRRARPLLREPAVDESLRPAARSGASSRA